MKLDAFSLSTIIGTVIIAVIFVVVISTNEDKIDTYLLGAFIAAEIILFLFNQLFQNRRSSRNEKKEHAQNICKVYKLLTVVRIEQDTQRPWKHFLKFSKGYTPIVVPSTGEVIEYEELGKPLHEDELKYCSDYDYYATALKHLEHRKYKHIYSHWKKTKNLLDKLNGKTSVEERLQGVIKEKMNHSFPTLQSAASGIEASDNYSVDHIIQFIMIYFRNQDLANHALASLAYGESDGTKFLYSQWRPKDFHIIMRSDGNLDSEIYTKLVKEMLDDTSLKDFYNEFADEHTNITKELSDFRNKLDELVNDLKISVPLEGKCKGCPS